MPPPMCHPDMPREIANDTVLVPRAFVERWIKYGAQEAPFGGCSIVPSFEDGKPIGLKQFGIQVDSALFRLGLRNGDVVMRINGEALDSPEQALATYEMVRGWWEAGHDFEIKLALRRRKTPATIRFVIQ